MTGQIITEVGFGVLWDAFFALLDTHFAASAKTLPVLRQELYKGQVKNRHAPQALAEMARVREKFQTVRTPPGQTLHAALVTSTGRNLVDELIETFAFAMESGYDVKIVRYHSPVATPPTEDDSPAMDDIPPKSLADERPTAASAPPKRHNMLWISLFIIASALCRGVIGWYTHDQELLIQPPRPSSLWWSAPPTALPPVDLPPAPTAPETVAQAEEFYQAGKAQFDAQEWQAAYRLFNRALQLNPRHALAYNYRGAPYYYLGMIYREEGETEAALAALTWAEQTLDEGALLDATRAALHSLAP